MAAVQNSPLLPEAKRSILNMIGAAANPDSGKIDVQIASLPREQQEKILKNANAMRKLQKGVTGRAKKELLAMSDAEWNALVEEANSEDTQDE